MPITMPEEKLREMPPPGAHVAVCAKIVDLGTQETKFGIKPQLYVAWELLDERNSEGKIIVVSKFYNLSSDPRSTLRQDVQGWLGRALTSSDFGKFDLTSLLGMTCLLAITHEEKEGRTRANITSLMKPPKGTQTRLPPANPAIALSLSDRPFDYVGYDSLPEWLKEMVAKSPEYRAATNGGAGPQARVAAHLKETPTPKTPASGPPTAENLDDEIPF